MCGMSDQGWKITGLKLKEDPTDGGLDRATELFMSLNRFSSK